MSPFELMFGRKPVCPLMQRLRVVLKLELRARRTSVEYIYKCIRYIKELHYRIATTRKIVEQRIEKSKGNRRNIMTTSQEHEAF